uniref:Uncharacterized protein n=1 Tax=Parascaris univalens TaxID=6257 RepID=A0A915AM79_PARUN
MKTALIQMRTTSNLSQIKIWMKLDEPILLIYTDFFNNISIVLPFLILAVMLSRFPKLRHKLHFWRPHKKHVIMSAPTKTVSRVDSEYFRYLQNQWNTASDQKRSPPMLKRFARVIHLAI